MSAGGTSRSGSYAGLPAAGAEATWRFAVAGALPQVVVRPATAAETASVVRLAADSGEAIVVAGKGARLAIGNPPRRYDVALSTEHMAAVEAYCPEDMTVTVQSGMTLGALNEFLGSSGQWLPLDPAATEQTTVGGLIAADACGPLRHSHGKIRDFLLGVEVVNGSGEIVRAGGRVVKNVAGYDVAKLLCGSFGTLGAITSATFKVRPRPAVDRIYVWRAASLHEAIERHPSLDRGGVLAAYVEALNAAACESIGLECAAATVLGLSGSAAEVGQLEEALRAASGGEARPVAADKSVGMARALRDFPLPINEEAMVARVALRPSHLADALARVDVEARSRGLFLEVAAHAGVGVARCQILGRGDCAGIGLFAEWLRIAVRERGGWVTYEAMPCELRGRVDPWGLAGPVVPLMRGVKRVFDPGHTFSPGRFVGGI